MKIKWKHARDDQRHYFTAKFDNSEDAEFADAETYEWLIGAGYPSRQSEVPLWTVRFMTDQWFRSPRSRDWVRVAHTYEVRLRLDSDSEAINFALAHNIAMTSDAPEWSNGVLGCR